MNKIIVSLSVLFTLVIGYFLGFYIRAGVPWSENASIFLIILSSGAFGGLLYTARDSGLELLHRDPDNQYQIKLGWVADCAFGIAGALVVFLVVPTELNNAENGSSILSTGSVMDIIRLMALALVGGYGGRSLVDKALSNIAKRADEAMQNAQEAKEKVNKMQEVDTKALELVNLHLDENEEVSNEQEMKDAIIKASKTARFEIFKEARSTRKEKADNPEVLKRLVPIFEALIENEAGEEYHRNHAQLAYCLKDKKDKEWKRAYEELKEAIKIRDKNNRKGFYMYEFNKAICGTHLEDVDNQEMINDLKTAAKSEIILEKIINEPKLIKWAEKNKFDLKGLKVI